MKTQQKVFTRLAALLLLFIVAAAAMPTASAAGWDYYRAINIDNAQVSGSADLPSFPVLINHTADWLERADTGDHVRRTDGYDIVFTDADNLNLLDYEVEEYNGTAGTLVAWVRIPTLDYDENTKIRLWYGNSAATDWSNPTGVWDDDYKAVWHLLGDGTDSLPESTSNSNTGTKTAAGEPANIAGQIDGAQDFDGENDDMTAGTTGFNMQRGTYEAWVNFDDWGNNQNDTIFSAPSEAAATSANLVGYWRFDALEGGNTVADLSEHGNTGTIYGTGGTADSGTANTLTDADKDWTVNEWASETIYITAGTGSEQERTVDSNTPTVITVTPNWDTNPDDTSEYAITPGTEFTAAGRFGAAVALDGSKGYVDCGNHASLDFTNTASFTLETWFKVENGVQQTTQYTDVVGKDHGGYPNGGYSLKIYNSNTKISATCGMEPNIRQAQYTTDINDGIWHHAVMVQTPASLKLYIDGILRATDTDAVEDFSHDGFFSVGCRPGVPDNFFNGTIDEVRIYDAALSADRIRGRYLGAVSAHKNAENNLVMHLGPATMTTSVSDLGGWHHVAGTWDNSPEKAYLYIDGVEKVNTAFWGGTRRIFGDYSYFGNDENNGMQFDGKQDEVRISATARSGDWIKTEFNNQDSPGTFYSVADAATPAPAGTDPVPDPSAMVLFAVGLVMLIVFFGWTKRRGGVK